MHRKILHYLMNSFTIASLFYKSRVEIILRTAPYETKNIYYMRAVKGKITNLFNDPKLEKNAKQEVILQSKVFKQFDDGKKIGVRAHRMIYLIL